MTPQRSPYAAESRALVLGLFRLADVAFIVAAGFLAYALRHDTLDLPPLYLGGIALGALLALNYFQIARLYAFENLRKFSVQFGAVAAAWSAVAVSLVFIAYFTKSSDQFSRAWAGLWFMFTFIGILGFRALAVLEARRWARANRLLTHVAIIGAGSYGERLIRRLESLRGSGFQIVGVWEPRRTRVPEVVAGYPLKGTIDDLLAHVREHRVDEIIIALPWQASQHLQDILKRLGTVAADVKLCPESVAFDLPNLGYSDVGGVPMLKLFERPLSGWNLVTKTVEDRLLAALFLALASPLLLLIALAIRLESPGPVLFRQKRYGFNNNEFTVLKFRTMRAEADNSDQIVQARRGDPRVTRLGAFLRATSLDELPQLINVLKGEMSLVGPRPHAVQHNERYAAVIDQYLGRHRVKPGITGWAQVNGLRGETANLDQMRQRVQHDLYYIENWSLLLDIKVLFLTIFVGFVHRNAY